MYMQKKGAFQSMGPKEGVSVALREIQESPGLNHQYERLDERWRQRFLDFCAGKKTLPLTYDPFFKKIFNPDVHPKRLSRFLSSILGKAVTVIRILPVEEYMLDGGALLIMDILVELEDGSLANCEIQKISYAFPGQRMSCYSADLVLRQYSRVRGQKGTDFKYKDMKPVYTIVIYEKSAEVFHEYPQTYIHHGTTTFDSGLKLELLQEYWLIALDVFREFPYPKDRSEQTAWLSLLATEDIADAEELVKEYPWLREIYLEMAEYMSKPKEVLNMFSEALRIMDRNTVQYMIEEQMDQIMEQNVRLEEQQRQIESRNAQIMEQDRQIDTQKEQIDTQKEQIDTQKEQIDTQKKQIDTQREQIENQLKEIAHLKELLGKEISHNREQTMRSEQSNNVAGQMEP